MKMGAGAPILDRHQARQNIDFFNSIRTKPPFAAAPYHRSLSPSHAYFNLMVFSLAHASVDVVCPEKTMKNIEYDQSLICFYYSSLRFK